MNEILLLMGICIGGMLALLLIFLPFVLLHNRNLKSKAGTMQHRLPQPPSPRRAMMTTIGLVLLILVWGFMVGFTSGVFSQLLLIVFLYPIVMGINSGKMIVDAIQRAKVRTISQLLLLSILSTVTMYGTYHYCRYLGFQIQGSFAIYENFSDATEEENLGVTKMFLDYALEEETGHSGFLGYMLYEAKQGVSIGRITRSSSFNLGPALTWLYWLLEFGIILGLTIQRGKKRIDMAFCESCGNWVGGEKHLGGTAFTNESFLLDLIRQKDFARLGTLMEPNAEVPSLEVYFQGCQVCGQSRSQLVVRRAFQGAKGALQCSDASQTTLQPTESAVLWNQFSFSGD